MKQSLIITSIANGTHPVLNTFARECKSRGIKFIIIGDKKSPEKFQLPDADFYDIKRQEHLPFSLSRLLPEEHYSRKNLGYLLAMKNGAAEISETDDDNIPLENFWRQKKAKQICRTVTSAGWVNVYNYFTSEKIWPRGYPHEELLLNYKTNSAVERQVWCPIQQGLADKNPDVDATYRINNSLPFYFEKNGNIALGQNAWCPFNSQNTHWFKESFPLMYLPSFCSFRMTDIWRSFIAQRIAWECGWNILYQEASVYQERNDHDLMKDLEDEKPGYLYNKRICEELRQLKLKPGAAHIAENMICCYEKLIAINIIMPEELSLLKAWLKDVKELT